MSATGDAPTPLEVHNKMQRELVKFDHEYADLARNLDDLVKILGRMVEGLKNEVLGDTLLALRNKRLDEGAVRKAKELTQAAVNAANALKSLQSTAKERAEKMSPDQRRQAFLQAVLEMPVGERRRFIQEAAEAHLKRHGEACKAGLEAPQVPVYEMVRV